MNLFHRLMDMVFVAHLIDVSDGGVHSETRTSDNTGNAHGNGVSGERWYELGGVIFTQFEWATGDSLRLAIMKTAKDQLIATSIVLDAAVEPR